jgi:hypothetical protein
MSRFIDKLKQLSQVESQPMGFRKEKSFSKSRLMLVADVEADAAAEVVEGADAMMLFGEAKKPAVKSDLPMGVKLFGSKAGKLEGIDFVILMPEMPFTIVEDEKIGKVMAVEASLEMGLLRSLDDLPLDALFIIGDGTQAQVVTWQYLMLCKRLAALSNKPVLASVSPQISKDELQMLWEVGVDGVVVASQTVGSLKKLRSLIDGLTAPSKSRRAKMRAIVPKIGEETAPIVDEEEEEDGLY